MKIVHVCLAGAFLEHMGYQENILTKFHKQMGYDTFVIRQDPCFVTGGQEKSASDYYQNEYGVQVYTLERSEQYGKYSYVGKYLGVIEKLREIAPDIIFVHGCQFVSLAEVVKYCKKNRHVKLYIDNHGDYYNMGIATYKSWILQHIIYGHGIRKARKYASKIWGVTPWRCQYLHEVYHIPEKDIHLLVMGGDDEYIHWERQDEIRSEIRKQYKIAEDDFLIVTGGKIDTGKNIHLLMQSVAESDEKKIKLLVFGKTLPDMEKTIESLSQNENIQYIGWVSANDVYDYFLASNLVVFPGTHSVLWEQACACGVPGIFKHWEGMHHVDVGGNADFLYQDSVAEIKEKILEIYHDREKYKKMLHVAEDKGTKEFSYKEIAKRAIEIEG